MDSIGNPNIRELLAEYSHKSWSKWMAYLLSKTLKNENGSVTIPAKLIEYWKTQMETEYKDLTDSERNSDRFEADMILKVLKGM